jgi:hypothetical protein
MIFCCGESSAGRGMLLVSEPSALKVHDAKASAIFHPPNRMSAMTSASTASRIKARRRRLRLTTAATRSSSGIRRFGLITARKSGGTALLASGRAA